jgi:ATPase subunit of ABC transporter with duplicated ATPase domains
MALIYVKWITCETCLHPRLSPYIDMLQVQNLTYSHDQSILLDRISLSVSEGEVVCLTGPNGSGKSTLLACLSGSLPVKSGQVLLNRDRSVGFVAQEQDHIPTLSAQERIWSYSPTLAPLHLAIEHNDYSSISDYQALGGYEVENKIDSHAENFGIDFDLADSYAELSRGQMRKVDLIGLLVSNVDLMVFDEPVNYLDIHGITAFEEGIRFAVARNRAALIVSHDRELVDNIATRTVHLKRGETFSVHGGYTAAIAHKEFEFDARANQAATLKRKIRGLETAMRQKMGWGIHGEIEDWRRCGKAGDCEAGAENDEERQSDRTQDGIQNRGDESHQAIRPETNHLVISRVHSNTPPVVSS